MASVGENLYQPLSARANDGFSKGSGSELLDTPLRPAKDEGAAFLRRASRQLL